DAWTDISALPHNSREKTKHPTQKPLAICERILNLFSPKNSEIFIPFAGSGSEIVSCILLERHWDATELNKDYFALIKQRIKNSQRSLISWL
ncbi:MAG: DNA methyltransferase, partial [Promethearchaeota archaeon]